MNIDLIVILRDYIVIPVIIACLVIGYCIKHIKWLKKVSNEYIPTILVICGILIVIAVKWGEITPIVIISGAFSGLASTGLHQIFKNIIERKNKEDNQYGL